MAYIAEFKRIENEKKLYEVFAEKSVVVAGETKTAVVPMGVYSAAGLSERIARAAVQVEEWSAMRDAINALEEKK